LLSAIHHHVQTASGAHPASYPMGSRALSLGIKWPVCKADNSPPSSAEVKNVWNYTSTSPICLHGMVLSLGTGTILPYLTSPGFNCLGPWKKFLYIRQDFFNMLR